MHGSSHQISFGATFYTTIKIEDTKETTYQGPRMDRKARLAELRNKRKGAVASEPAIEPDTSDEPAQPEATPVDVPEEAPTLRISENETVEAVASRIQEEIFERIYNEADVPAATTIPKGKNSYTKDLEKDIEPYTTRARLSTDKAINHIIRKKYEENLSAGN